MSSKIERVSQKELIKFARAAEDLASLRRRMDETVAAMAQLESEILGRLSAGAKVEQGRYTAAVEMKRGQIRPAWKELYIEHFVNEHEMAAEMVEQQARKSCTPSISPVLVIGVTLTNSLRRRA